ncbi:MAG: hypothetical protein Q8P05_01800 [Candidatus Diapherotrites archaeon]|nr:hypothetical protein [Candidatus Diapherotrites archaeon]MDZ4256750.1 hypothetical protein [archaeon]
MMEIPFFLKSPILPSIILIGLGMVGIMVLVQGYCPDPNNPFCGNSDPAKMGHPSNEIEYTFNSYQVDCSGSNFPQCYADCQLGNEVAVGGNCINGAGWVYWKMGISSYYRWECTDLSWPTVGYLNGKFIAEVKCMEVN